MDNPFADYVCWCSHSCCVMVQQWWGTPIWWDCEFNQCGCHPPIEDDMAWDDATWD